MVDISLVVWAIALVVTAGGAAIQGTVGVGYGMVTVPILALLEPTLSPVPQLLTAVPLTIAMAWRERHAIDFKGVGWLIVGRLPGAAIGVALLAVATQRLLDLFIGAVVIVAVLVIGAGMSVNVNPLTQFSAGVASGTTSLVASIGGPPTALLYSKATAPTLRATLAAVFSLGIIFNVAVRFATGNVVESDLRVSAVLLPAVLVGWAMSVRHKHRFSGGAVRLGVLGVSGAAAVGLLVRAITG